MANFRKDDKILVVGGSGFIGAHLVERCRNDTPFVTCLGLHRKEQDEADGKDPEYLHADLSDRVQLMSALKGKSFDYVFNLGGYINHSPYSEQGRAVMEAHFTGLLNLIESLNKEKLKSFVQVGSSDEYGGAVAPQSETSREMPISPYSLAKTAGSHFIQMLSHTENFPGLVVRLFLVYGPGQDHRRFLPQIIKACLKNEAFKTSEGKQLRDFCYVEDVVEGMVSAAMSPVAHGKVINMASGIPVSVKEVIERVIDLVGGGEPLWGAYPYRNEENMKLYADIELAAKLFAWRPETSLDQGLTRTIAYYQKEGKP